MITIPTWLVVCALCLIAMNVGILIGRAVGRNGDKPPLTRPSDKGPTDPRIRSLLDADDPMYTEDDDGMKYPTYKRRDRPERRDDWATYIKHQQDQDQDHEQ